MSVRLASAELVASPADREQPRLYVDLQRDGATQAECRRWAAALLEAADQVDQLRPP